MRKYLLRRLILVIPTLILVSVAVFAIIRLIPGDVVEMMVAENTYAANLDEMRRMLGLDKPIYIQYINWVGEMVRGDLGTSLWTKRTALQEITYRWPVTLELAALAILWSLLIGIPIGILSAVRQDSLLDYIFRSLAILALALPAFWLATLVVVLPSIHLNWSPPLTFTRITDNPGANLRQLLIPSLILSFSLAGMTMRMARAMMLEVLRQDYIRTAWAKGLRERVVLYRHASRNAMIPVITLIGIQIPRVIIGGSIVIEQIFQLPGMGQFMVEVIMRRDYPLLQSLTLTFALMVIAINLLVDFLYSVIDPRIRYA